MATHMYRHFPSTTPATLPTFPVALSGFQLENKSNSLQQTAAGGKPQRISLLAFDLHLEKAEAETELGL